MTELATRDPGAALAAALAAVQAELPEIKKTRTAKVEKDGRLLYTYDYADLADVSLAILPILGKHGLAFTSFPGHRPDGKFGLRYQLLHEEGAVLEGFYEIADQGGMQMTGGRITYARRYCLCAVTGVAAEDDVDANGSGSDQQQPRTAQRAKRPQTSPPAPEVRAPAPPTPGAERAGGDGPPLPGEEDAPGPAPSAAGPGAPDSTDYDTAGTVTNRQLTAIWTSLSQTYHFGPDEKDAARGVCAQILNITLGSSKDLSHNQARTVLDTLAHWKAQAEHEEENPRGYLMVMLEEARKAREAAPRAGDGQEGGGDG